MSCSAEDIHDLKILKTAPEAQAMPEVRHSHLGLVGIVNDEGVGNNANTVSQDVDFVTKVFTDSLKMSTPKNSHHINKKSQNGYNHNQNGFKSPTKLSQSRRTSSSSPTLRENRITNNNNGGNSQSFRKRTNSGECFTLCVRVHSFECIF